MMKIFFFLMGVIFILLGIIGLLLPVVPQIPFLALGMMFLCAASNRFKRMLMTSKIYQRYFKSWVDSHEKIKKFMGDDL